MIPVIEKGEEIISITGYPLHEASNKTENMANSFQMEKAADA